MRRFATTWPARSASACSSCNRFRKATPASLTGSSSAVGAPSCGSRHRERGSPVPLHAELRRWTWLVERAPAELTGDAPQLARRLETGVPHDTGPVVVHGDYHFGNMLFAGSRVSAVLDWEIAELGHPLLDLCCL